MATAARRRLDDDAHAGRQLEASGLSAATSSRARASRASHRPSPRSPAAASAGRSNCTLATADLHLAPVRIAWNSGSARGLRSTVIGEPVPRSSRLRGATTGVEARSGCWRATDAACRNARRALPPLTLPTRSPASSPPPHPRSRPPRSRASALHQDTFAETRERVSIGRRDRATDPRGCAASNRQIRRGAMAGGYDQSVACGLAPGSPLATQRRRLDLCRAPALRNSATRNDHRRPLAICGLGRSAEAYVRHRRGRSMSFARLQATRSGAPGKISCEAELRLAGITSV